MDKQIVELQTRLAFQENTILNCPMCSPGSSVEIAALTTKLDLVQQQVIELMQIEPGGREAEPPPPHYYLQIHDKPSFCRSARKQGFWLRLSVICRTQFMHGLYQRQCATRSTSGWIPCPRLKMCPEPLP